MDSKLFRPVTTTLLGVVFGIIYMLLSKYTTGVNYWPMGVSFLLHHTVMGLAIGASSLRMNWATHGVFWGAIFGLFLAISTEFAQSLLPVRNMSFYDLFADIAGLGIALALCAFLHRQAKLRAFFKL